MLFDFVTQVPYRYTYTTHFQFCHKVTPLSDREILQQEQDLQQNRIYDSYNIMLIFFNAAKFAQYTI